MHFITLTTENFILNTIRLIKSLKRVHPFCSISVYTESDNILSAFFGYDVKVHIIPEISYLGIKRAKFIAYAHASKGGQFVYLDSDIVVLQPLDGLINTNIFTACRDDLSECPFIIDRQHPWKNYPQWKANRYFNSGVFAVPAGYDTFFAMLYKEAMDDADWGSIVIPGELNDNHYLCAKIVQHDLPINFISEFEYNWQGFRRLNELNCYVDEEGALRNKLEGTLLRLVHFAGIQDIDDYVGTLPIEISRVLAIAISKQKTGILEQMNAAIFTATGIEERLKLQLIKSMGVTSYSDQYSPGEDRPLVAEAASTISIVLSTKTTNFLWNGLKCGASYLAATEYKGLRDFIQSQKIGAILEFGAGYTTTLFNKLVKKQVALEGWDGPWLDFARTNGCDARIVKFLPDVGFDEKQLRNAIQDIRSANETTMVFIDSPPGTLNRGLILEQVLRLFPDADYYVIHDSVRDSQNVYRLAAVLGLQIIDYLPSWRGMIFLGRSLTQSQTVKKNIFDTDWCRQVEFAVTFLEKYSGVSGVTQVFIELRNIGVVVLPSSNSDGLLFSLHLVSSAGDIIAWDTPRYSLPVDLAPGDSVSFYVTIPSEYETVNALDCDFVKEGEFWWSNIAKRSCPRINLV